MRKWGREGGGGGGGGGGKKTITHLLQLFSAPQLQTTF